MPLVRASPEFVGLARTGGIAQIKMIELTAGQSPASHPAAKPEWMESRCRIGA